MLTTKGPVFLNIEVDRNENVFPMIPAGAPHNEIVLGPNQNLKTVDDKSNVMA
jgi:acetolactate synthase-1/2/3 large subunit